MVIHLRYNTKRKLRYKGSMRCNMLLSIGGLFLLFALCFSLFQYQREREFKVDILHSRLQVYNHELHEVLGDSVFNPSSFRQYLQRANLTHLRTTIIKRNGTVLFDSEQSDVSKMDNHLGRTEVRQALRQGNGYEVKRVSESTHEQYLYSATCFPARNKRDGDIIIRTALPYNAEILRSLQTDNTYIYVALLLVVLFGAVLYYYTSRIGRHVSLLRDFAEEAEKADTLDTYTERQLPHDELGDISHRIIGLYSKLRNAEATNTRLKRQLTENVAHELKTPTASINGYLECILSDPSMTKLTRNTFLERCYAQSNRMVHLLQDISTLTKLDQTDNDGGTPLQREEVDVKRIIDSVLADVRLQLEETNITIALHLPERINVMGDPSMLYSIFRNLTDNAICYATGATHLSITATPHVEGDSDYYIFTVSDNGVGVSDEHLDRIFERFYRVDKGRSRKMGGTGLGLSIVRNALLAHHGSIHAEHTPGGGLTIVFTLAEK